MDEAANIDGCGKMKTLFYILIPMVSPAIVTSTIFSFYWMWQDFFQPLIFMNTPEKYTVSLALKLFLDPAFIQQLRWHVCNVLYIIASGYCFLYQFSGAFGGRYGHFRSKGLKRGGGLSYYVGLKMGMTVLLCHRLDKFQM